jgi:hypothetical protein
MNFNAIQAYYPLVGEAPVLSPQYDNGNHVFYFYANGSTLSGWLTHGYAGVSSSSNGVDRVPPANGLPFNGYAFYANSSLGSYLNTSVGSLPTDNVIIEYYTYTTALGDLFFFTNYNGYGQMARVGGVSVSWYGIATTSSWTSWNGPSGTGYYSGRWVLVGVVVSGTQATEYLSNVASRMLYGQEIGLTPYSASISIQGNSIGLVGDGAGQSQITYWMGIIIRPLPPNGVIPSVSVSIPVGQYVVWKYSPVSNVINATIHVTSYPSGIQSSPGIVVYSPNIGDQPNDVGNFQLS